MKDIPGLPSTTSLLYSKLAESPPRRVTYAPPSSQSYHPQLPAHRASQSLASSACTPRRAPPSVHPNLPYARHTLFRCKRALYRAVRRLYTTYPASRTGKRYARELTVNLARIWLRSTDSPAKHFSAPSQPCRPLPPPPRAIPPSTHLLRRFPSPPCPARLPSLAARCHLRHEPFRHPHAYSGASQALPSPAYPPYRVTYVPPSSQFYHPQPCRITLRSHHAAVPAADRAGGLPHSSKTWR